MTWQNEPSPENLEERDREGAPHAETTVDGSAASDGGARPTAPHTGEGTQARTPPAPE
ncbi:hypothetical protein OVN20_08820 [Microcella daejeonensis]|uniref:hypothetical protein n=1 Tax=Microcella daejeonensis TaxID=2994971 RepID=UPI00226E1DEF|nr:hypothetical protein [Microcella daejeonensis]WAB83190.1 hypothetical protein OVN20_08820 [Microcella daejeonensis]